MQEEKPEKREDLVSQAVDFLRKPAIVGSDREKKVVFLKAKGLTRDEIDEAFARAESSDPTSANSSESSTEPGSVASDNSDSISMPSVSNGSIPAPSDSSEPASVSSAGSDSTEKDSSDDNNATISTSSTYAPPVIKIEPEKPESSRWRLSGSQVASALYLAMTAGGTLWVAHNYIFQPMHINMTAARSEYLTDAIERMDNLLDSLSATVTAPPQRDEQDRLVKTIGTQTEKENDQDLAIPSYKISQVHAESHKSVEPMLRLASTLRDIQPSPQEIFAGTELAFSLENIRTYLDGLLGVTVMSSAARDDETTKLKNEIRSMKGSVLNIRNFPARAN